MDDRLEKFIKSNRAEMDDKSPGHNLWAEIEKELQPEVKEIKLSKSHILWRAAAVILLLVTSWLAFEKVQQSDTDGSGMEMSKLNPDLMEAESFYLSLIDQKRNEISAMGDMYNLGADFSSEINTLDSMYMVLKKDMINGSEENLVDAMIVNLQLRIEILNRQLNIIQSIEKSQRDETIIL